MSPLLVVPDREAADVAAPRQPLALQQFLLRRLLRRSCRVCMSTCSMARLKTQHRRRLPLLQVRPELRALVLARQHRQRLQHHQRVLQLLEAAADADSSVNVFYFS